MLRVSVLDSVRVQNATTLAQAEGFGSSVVLEILVNGYLGYMIVPFGDYGANVDEVARKMLESLKKGARINVEVDL